MAVHIGDISLSSNNEEIVSEVKKDSDFICKILDISKIQNLPYSFTLGDVKEYRINDKVIYVWQDVKGNISYKYDSNSQEIYSTTITKLGNMFTRHFGINIELFNNINDFFKKKTLVITDLNKAISDSNNYDNYSNYTNYAQETLQQPLLGNNIDDIFVMTEQVPLNDNAIEPQNQIFDQKTLHQENIALSSFKLQYRNQTAAIYVNELPVVVKEDFKPEAKQFFYKENGLIYKNSYIASKYMTNLVFQLDIINSFTLSFILYMAKGDATQALHILVWFANSFNFLKKLPFALVLHSDCDKYMKLFYEEIVEPFFNPDHCEEINSDDLTKKALSVKLDKKVIYHFKDIVEATIFKAPANELIKRVQYKDTYKLNNKTTITKANILITSTSNYIPLIAKDVKSIVVNVESDLKSFCKAKNITTDPYYTVADLIKQDLPNFSSIIRYMDMDKLHCLFQQNYYDGNSSDIMDSDANILEVFEASFKCKDRSFFKIIEKKSPKLYQQLMDDLDINRVNRKNLLDYFSLLFGENIYKNNTALIAALRKISSTDQPFENDKAFQIGKDVYYTL